MGNAASAKERLKDTFERKLHGRDDGYAERQHLVRSLLFVAMVREEGGTHLRTDSSAAEHQGRAGAFAHCEGGLRR
jgi:hypothetical protein